MKPKGQNYPSIQSWASLTHSRHFHTQLPESQGLIRHFIIESTLPENGDTGGVEPAGEAGADPLLWYPAGFMIMILRVTFIASSGESPL